VTGASVPDELVGVLGHYALGELRAAWWIERGFVNANWVLVTDQGRYFLKRRHPDLRRPALIRAQHALMRRLREVGFPAPMVLRTTQGQTLLILDDEFYEIQGYIEGQPYDHDRLAHVQEAAVTLGRYHTCVQGFAFQALREPGELYHPTLLKGVLTDLIEAWQLGQKPDLAQIVGQLTAHADELTECFAGHAPLPRLVIHGDYYAGNLLFEGDHIVGVVDYDKARWQPRVVELAEALIYFASPRPGHLKHLVYPGFLDRKPFLRFLGSYARTTLLDGSELYALPDYIRCTWLQVSLARLLEKGSSLPEAREALSEVLALADWARANADRMVQAGRSAALGC
jgi:homoserine kinase type II